eukprot:12059431-Heterocapsa_arctica.AAC.1
MARMPFCSMVPMPSITAILVACLACHSSQRHPSPPPASAIIRSEPTDHLMPSLPPSTVRPPLASS